MELSNQSHPTAPTTGVSSDRPVVVIGAGPAGLTAAYELRRLQVPVTVVEQSGDVGGLARTVRYKGFRFDIGGHRFFTKVGVVRQLWRQMLGGDFLRRPRLSRIYYRGRFFHYPIQPLNALRQLGVITTLQVLASYLWVKICPIEPEDNLEDWVSNRFGRKLYQIFFATYTQKVWGIPPNTIDAAWAAQRIKGLSIKTAIKNMVGSGPKPRTLIEEFEYPRLGPGMMWETMAQKIREADGHIMMQTSVVAIHHDGSRVHGVDLCTDGRTQTLAAGHVISTMPVRELIRALRPAPPVDVLAAANRLSYRDFLTVALIIEAAALFPDNWIYVHDESVKVGRIQNFKNWSPDMVPDLEKTCLGLEYFCFEHDGLWSMEDNELIALATRELARLGLARADQVVDGAVVRAAKAYPVYDAGYTTALTTVRGYLAALHNLQLVGRNGMHKYNNQDHSMLTAMLAVRNLHGECHDLWSVNVDDEYHEEERGQATEDAGAQFRSRLPAVPRRLDKSVRRVEPSQSSE